VDGAFASSVPHVLNAAEGAYCQRVIRVDMDDAARKKGIRRTALIVTAIAVAFYVGFIMIGVLRSGAA
jgi:hypothetical protein